MIDEASIINISLIIRIGIALLHKRTLRKRALLLKCLLVIYRLHHALRRSANR